MPKPCQAKHKILVGCVSVLQYQVRSVTQQFNITCSVAIQYGLYCWKFHVCIKLHVEDILSPVDIA